MSSFIVKAGKAKIPLFYVDQGYDIRDKIFTENGDLDADKEMLLNLARVHSLSVDKMYGLVLFEADKQGSPNQKAVIEEALKVMNPSLKNPLVMRNVLSDYETMYDTMIKQTKTSYREYRAMQKKLEKANLTIPETVDEEYQDKSMEVVISSNIKPVTIYIFDNAFAKMNATYDIPVIVFVSRRGIRVKTHISMNFYEVVDSSSLEVDSSYDSGIYLFPRDGDRIDLLFRDMVDGFGTIRLDVTTTVKKQDLYEKSLRQCMDGSGFDLTFGTSTMLQLDGRFKIPKTINLAAFSHLMYMNEIFKYHLYTVERTNTIMEKVSYIFRIKTYQTRCRLDEDGYFSVMGSKKKSTIRESRDLVASLVALCIQEQGAVLKTYKSLLPDLTGEFTVGKPTLKEDKKGRKMGAKATELMKKRPYLFRKTYPSICQPRVAQPIIVDDIPSSANEEKYFTFEDPATGKSDVYTCEHPKYSWIGLKKNTSSNETYQDEVPYFPCCYIQNQYQKTSSALRKYMEGEESGLDVPGVREVGYILRSDKPARDGKYAEIPPNLQRIAVLAGYRSEKSAFLRYGMNVNIPDSMVHNLLLLTSEEYKEYGWENRKKIVRRVRKKLSKHPVAVAKQELFDLTTRKMKDVLRDPEAHLHPVTWVRLMEDFFKVRIHLYDMKADQILIPRHRKVHIPPTYDPSTPHVVMGLFGSHVEILVKNEGTRELPGVFDSSEKLMTTLSLLERSKIYRYRPDRGVSRYSPSDVMEGEKQYVDMYGKMQMVSYGGTDEIVPPSAPIAAQTAGGDEASKLRKYQQARRVADLYKAYTTLLYFMNGRVPLTQDNFVIQKGHQLAVSDVFSAENFVGTKLLVPSKTFVKRLSDLSKVLHAFGKLSVQKDFQDLSIGSAIPYAYRTVSDFYVPRDQRIFFTMDAFVLYHEYKWMVYLRDTDDTHVIQKELIPEAIFPYFYQGDLFDGELVMIQNVKDDTASVVDSVLRRWEVDGMNVGYYAGTNDTNLTRTRVKTVDTQYTGVLKKDTLYRLLYPTGRFGAILRL